MEIRRPLLAVLVGLAVVSCVARRSGGTRREGPKWTRLVSGADAAEGPRYSPDGRWIAFTARQGGRPSIAVVRADGGTPMLLLTSGASFQPSWSPDGTRLAFATLGADGSDVWTIPYEGGPQMRVTSGSGAKEEPDWSPDGNTIAYGSGQGGDYGIWTVSLPDGAQRLLTTQKGNEWSPRWSPDGRFVAFVADWADGGKTDIWMISREGGEPVRLTSTTDDEYSPAWSPDGARLAFLSDAGGLSVMDVSTRKVVPIAPEQGFRDIVSWSPDGRSLAVSMNPNEYHLWRVGADGGKPQRIPVTGTKNERTPAYSPSGSRIAFVSLDWDGNADIWSVAAMGGTPDRLTKGPESDLHPAWSPDGEWIAFSSRRQGAHGDIWKMDRQGTAVQLTSIGHARWPRWCGGGQRIVFESARTSDGNTHVWAVASDGGEAQPITSGVFELEPDCSSTDVLVYVGADAPGAELFSASADGTAPRRLTRDRAWARAPRWSPDGSRIAYLSNVDGSWEIRTVAAFGGESRRVTFDGGEKYSVAWSPDGASLLYSVRAGKSEIWTIVAPGHRPTITSPRDPSE